MNADEHNEKQKAIQKEQREQLKEKTIKRGILVVNTGDGKGKSTAAFGTAMRAVGHGQRVGMVQFIKGSWKVGEQKIFERFDEIDHVISGNGFTWNTQDREADIASVRKGWEAACDMIEKSRGEEPAYQLVILDELNIALRYDYLPIEEVVRVFANKPEKLNIMVTGRDAKPELMEIADTVTEMVPIKHAFDANIKAQKGMEY